MSLEKKQEINGEVVAEEVAAKQTKVESPGAAQSTGDESVPEEIAGSPEFKSAMQRMMEDVAKEHNMSVEDLRSIEALDNRTLLDKANMVEALGNVGWTEDDLKNWAHAFAERCARDNKPEECSLEGTFDANVGKGSWKILEAVKGKVNGCDVTSVALVGGIVGAWRADYIRTHVKMETGQTLDSVDYEGQTARRIDSQLVAANDEFIHREHQILRTARAKGLTALEKVKTDGRTGKKLADQVLGFYRKE